MTRSLIFLSSFPNSFSARHVYSAPSSLSVVLIISSDITPLGTNVSKISYLKNKSNVRKNIFPKNYIK